MFLVIFTIGFSRIPTNIINAAESRSGWTKLKEISASTSLWCCCSYALEVECEERLFSFHVRSLVMMTSDVYQTVSFFLLVGPSYIKYAAFFFIVLFQSYCSPHRADQRCEHSGQAPSSSSRSGSGVTWEHELGELRWRFH